MVGVTLGQDGDVAALFSSDFARQVAAVSSQKPQLRQNLCYQYSRLEHTDHCRLRHNDSNRFR